MITPDAKLKIVLEALMEERHIGDIASEYGIHSTTITIKRWVEWDLREPHLTIKDQVDLLSVNRTSLYRKDSEPYAEEVKIKHMIDRIHTESLSRGSRASVDDINNMKRVRVNSKRIRRYMRQMVIQSFYPGPNLTNAIRHITSSHTCYGI